MSDKALPLPSSAVRTALAHASHPVFALDYDGTLVPLVANPAAAAPTPELVESLAALAARPRTTVTIISGRMRAELESWVGHLPIWLVAEHGAAWRAPGESDWRDTAGQSPEPTSWKPSAIEVMRAYHLDGCLIEEKPTAIAWHYRNCSAPEAAKARATELCDALRAAVGEQAQVRHDASNAGMVVEVCTSDKGAAIGRLLSIYPQTDFVFAAGDAQTDEDMFARLREVGFAWTVRVGSDEQPTAARYRLRDPEAVRRLLQDLAQSP